MRKTYRIQVDCANCAAKMESALNKFPEIESAKIIFMTEKMIINWKDGVDEKAMLPIITRECQKIDRDFEVRS